MHLLRNAIVLLLFASSALAQPLSSADPGILSQWRDLRRGLVAYWQMEESTGTRYDRTSFGNHLTAANNPGNTTGRVGFGGNMVRASGQYFSVPNNTTSLTFTNGASIEILLWCQLASKTGDQNWLLSKYSGSPPGEFELSYRVSSNAFRWNLVSNSTDYVVYSTNVNTQTGIWYLVRAWYDASTKEVGISVNGSTAVTKAGPDSLVASTSAIEVAAEDEGNTFDGIVDEVGIWNRRLTTADYQTITNIVTWPRFQR